MDIIWSKQNHVITKDFGTKLRGFIRNNERPDTILFTEKEVKDYRTVSKTTAEHYIQRVLIPCLKKC